MLKDTQVVPKSAIFSFQESANFQRRLHVHVLEIVIKIVSTLCYSHVLLIEQSKSIHSMI